MERIQDLKMFLFKASEDKKRLLVLNSGRVLLNKTIEENEIECIKEILKNSLPRPFNLCV